MRTRTLALGVEFEERDLDMITILANHKHEKIKEMLGPRFNYEKPGKK